MGGVAVGGDLALAAGAPVAAAKALRVPVRIRVLGAAVGARRLAGHRVKLVHVGGDVRAPLVVGIPRGGVAHIALGVAVARPPKDRGRALPRVVHVLARYAARAMALLTVLASGLIVPTASLADMIANGAFVASTVRGCLEVLLLVRVPVGMVPGAPRLALVGLARAVRLAPAAAYVAGRI